MLQKQSDILKNKTCSTQNKLKKPWIQKANQLKKLTHPKTYRILYTVVVLEVPKNWKCGLHFPFNGQDF